MDVLITGGAGFIGSRLGAALIRTGRSVTVVDSLHPQIHRDLGRPDSLDGEVELVLGDVSDGDFWDRLFAVHGPPAVVFHLAAETGTGQSLREASRHGTVNVLGTTTMTDALARHEHVPGHIVLTSSRAVYGEGAWIDDAGAVFYPPPRSSAQLAAGIWDPISPHGRDAQPLAHEAISTWPRPTNVYAATKLAQEHILEAWCASFGVPLSILRLQNVYGPGQAIGNSYTGVLTFFARQLASGEQLDVYEDGNILRDFVFVDDVVDALVKAGGQPPVDTSRYDIGCGGPLTLLAVAESMSRLAGGVAPRVSGRYRPGDVRAASADITQAVASLAWKPTTPLDAGLEALLRWVTSAL